MSTDHSASASATGYLYQALYALYYLLRNEEASIIVEGLDDIEFDHGEAKELLQLKHHATRASLTDFSPDLWKTIRVWSDHLAASKINLQNTKLLLVTTATAASGSIAERLRIGATKSSINKELVNQLLDIAKVSENKTLAPSFKSFCNLSEDDRLMLVSRISIVDQSPKISNVPTNIKERIKGGVNRKYRDHLYDRLTGWWFTKVIKQLSGDDGSPITGYEVWDRVSSIAEEFKPDSLPIDFLDEKPDTIDADNDNRIFVHQLRSIAIHNTRIEKAIIDYYCAFRQRSRWTREDLLIDDELHKYERLLIDEWERFSLAIQEETDGQELSENECISIGRKVYNWMDQKADFRIRNNVTAPYVMRGSYHMLADSNPPRVWWHPKFTKRLEELLKSGIVQK